MSKPETLSTASYSALWKSVHDLPLTELLEVWDDFDKGGTDVEAIREACLNDRYYLLVKVLGRTDVWHPWIYARCREVEAEPYGCLDIWGREHYKSTIITFAGSIQEILRDPEITIGLFSHVKGIAKKFLAQIQRELQSNATLKELFPDILYAEPERDSPSWSLDNGITVIRKGNPKEATMEAHGLVDGQPTSAHFGLLLYDDVVTKESVNTPEQIQKTTEAWELSDNLGVAGGPKIMVGTRYSFGDTYQEIIKRKAVKLRHRPATHDGTISGEPVLFSPLIWAKKVIDQGEATICCQMLGNPLGGHQRMFDQADIQVYEVRPNTLMAYLMVDPARSTKKDSANTAMAVVALDYAGNKYLLDGINHKLDLQGRWNALRTLWGKWVHAPGIQGLHVGYERTGAQADLDYFMERQKVERVSFPIVELEWPREGPGSKIDRVQRLGPDIRGHRFYVPYPTDPNNLTAAQKKMIGSGYDYRISQKIRGVDENKKIYDLTEQFKLQVHFFPFGGLKDLVDAVARIYDMEPKPPVFVDQSSLEPEYV